MKTLIKIEKKLEEREDDFIELFIFFPRYLNYFPAKAAVLIVYNSYLIELKSSPDPQHSNPRLQTETTLSNSFTAKNS